MMEMRHIEYENLAKLNHPFFDEYQAAFKRVMEGGWYILGKEVQTFETAFAAYCGTAHCIGVANGLDALMLALKCLNLQAGDEVLVPSNTYIATILAIMQNGLKPVLVEPDIRTYNIDPTLIEAAITPRTKAIMVVHLYGKLCDMPAIMAIAEQHKLTVIEDCAQAHGAHIDGRKAGNWGDFGAFSFYPTKNLGALADAGAMTCNRDDYAQMLRSYRNYGSAQKYYNERIGYNSRLDEVQAAFLTVKLKALDAINDHKRSLAAIYQAGIDDAYIKPHVDARFFDVFHIYNIRHPKRDALRAYLLEHGVKTEIHYPVAPNKQVAMKGVLDHMSTPIAELIHQTTLSLPISYFHTAADMNQVIELLNAWKEK
jgi:dTDP-4-amino-4,6-dideoxygalactose transaminase